MPVSAQTDSLRYRIWKLQIIFSILSPCILVLGKDVLHRKELMKVFSKVYEWRSKVVHTGKIPNKTKKIPFTQEEINEFIKNAQDLCRDSIMKIVEDGKFPDWNNLILGEESS